MPLFIDESEVTVTAVRAQGAGGQNVNKVSSAIHLRFDIGASSLPDEVKQEYKKQYWALYDRWQLDSIDVVMDSNESDPNNYRAVAKNAIMQIINMLDSVSPDNTDALQSAFDANDVVYLPEGTFVTKLIEPNRAKVVLFGPGKLKLKQGEFSEIILIGADVEYLQIKGVEFIGNKSNTVATDPTLRKRLLNAASPDAFAVVRDCVFHGSNYGGFSIDGKYVTLERNYVYDCGYTAGVGDGISVVSYDPERVVVQNNVVLDAADYGIAVDAVNVVIQNNYVKGAQSTGIGSLARGATGSYSNLGVNMKVIGNTIIDSNNPMEFFCSSTENTVGFIGLEVCNNYKIGRAHV